MSDLNVFTCIGRLGEDPKTHKFQDGNEVANFRIAISEVWRSNGEKKERTLWMPVKVTNKGLVSVAADYLRKGSQVGLSGKLESREYDKDGIKVQVVELNIGPFGGSLTLLGGRRDGGSSGQSDNSGQRASQSSGAASGAPAGGMDDDIPFSAEFR